MAERLSFVLVIPTVSCRRVLPRDYFIIGISVLARMFLLASLNPYHAPIFLSNASRTVLSKLVDVDFDLTTV